MKTTIIVNKNGMGTADDELKQVLVKNYFKLLADGEMTPDYICFYAEGVKLTCIGSSIIEEIKILETKGTVVLICKTCLSHYGLLENVEAGTVATMLDIIGAQNNCDKVISI